MKLNVAPTKSNSLELKRSLAFASEGYELLEQKRQILVFELMSRLERSRTIQKEVDGTLAGAFASLREAVLRAGSARLAAEALGVPGRPTLRLQEERLMGINLPGIVSELPPAGPTFAPGSGPAVSDQVVKRFRQALEVVTRMAELENAVILLANELRKTQRRVNALEKIFLPDYRDTLKYIAEVLEEREREGYVIMKMTKARLEVADAS